MSDLVGRAVEAAKIATQKWWDGLVIEGESPADWKNRMETYPSACELEAIAILGVVADHCTNEAIRESEASFRLPAVDQQALGAIVAYRALAAELRETP